jgi:hypothetical protein
LKAVTVYRAVREPRWRRAMTPQAAIARLRAPLAADAAFTAKKTDLLREGRCSGRSRELGTCTLVEEEAEEAPDSREPEFASAFSCSATGSSRSSLGWLVFAPFAVFAAARRRRGRELPS